MCMVVVKLITGRRVRVCVATKNINQFHTGSKTEAANWLDILPLWLIGFRFVKKKKKL